jgi:hypothetical protein
MTSRSLVPALMASDRPPGLRPQQLHSSRPQALRLAVTLGACPFLATLPLASASTLRSFSRRVPFEGTSEIQRMLIGRAVTGLDVR